MKSKMSAENSEISTEISENSAENLAEILENSAENVNCLLDLYNARANLNFLCMFFAANFNPVQKLESRQILSSVRQNLDFC